MIEQNLLRIKERISAVCLKTGRDFKEIRLVAVTKGRTIDEIKEVLSAGIVDLGENRVQEALVKHSALHIAHNAQPVKWHMVGHLQTNKAREAVEIFDLIHSVDSGRLAREINDEAFKLNKVQDILIQVNVSREETKFGLRPDEIIGLVKKIAELKNINIKGLMTIAPLTDNPEKARPYFRMLRELKDKIKIYQSPITNHQSPILSMGMSADFEIALEEGSTMLRLGRAIFEGLK